ncbi:uncharacterized peroxidase-related enzyme [Polaromonas sp. YR568]|uniref:carboxymuconolactone decarboxylase family protein n=1 Tax=Polaromonas sp. YR568 TaxID=1855301 RepID=UPI0008DF625B|nr:hypothetical protein [Polaromonas sp. YR568]SFU89208.1 uncharacterized peroxidase-related enzyme [Polaromonas sp. YR568]
MFLQTPADSDAAARLFQNDLEQHGFVMNLSRLWAWRPEVCEAFGALRTQLTGSSSLSERELAVIVCATAGSLGDSYCALAWGKKLATAADPSAAAAVLQGVENIGLTPRDLALAAWTRKVARNPNDTTPQDVEALRAAGFSEREIFEATAFVAFRLAFSTINDALGVKPDWQLAAAAPPEVNTAVRFGRPVAERG